MNGRFNNRGGNGWGAQQNGRTYPQRGRNQQQPREDGDYPPNTGQLSPNARARNDNDPHMSGVMNIEIEGRRYTFFISGWENKPGIFRLSFNPADGGGNRQGGFRQGQRSFRGNGRAPNGGGYRQSNGGYDQAPMDDYQPRQNGAMSRARAIPEPQYYDEAPPHDQIPDGPNQFEEAPFFDR